MIEFIVTIVYCIILIILSILFVIKTISFFSNKAKFAGGMCIYLSVLTLFFQFMEGINTIFLKSKIFVRIVIMSIRRMRNLTIALNVG